MKSRSTSSQFARSAIQASARVGGAHLTRQARERTLARLQEMLSGKYNNLRSVDQLSAKHIREYVQFRENDNVSKRTLQNELSHIRAVMDPNRAQAVEMSNKTLGINGGSRIGSKTAASAEEVHAWREKAESLGRDGIAAGLELQRELGLRSQELVRANAEQLRIWIREASMHGRVTVVHGTKGGKVRAATVPDASRAVPALVRAAAVAEAQGGYLIARADGNPAKNLESATTIYRSYCNRHEIETHRCRYAYAREVYGQYREAGLSDREACSRLGVDLGHGDRRGRYVRSVYLR